MFVGDQAAIENLAPPELESKRPVWLLPAIGGMVFVVVIVLLATHC
jgi:hypothetical protein